MAARARRDRPQRLLLVTDSAGIGGAEIVLSHLVAGLGPGWELALAGPDAVVLDRIAAGRAGVRRVHVAAASVADHVRALRAVRPGIVHLNLTHPYACSAALTATALAPGLPAVAVEHLVQPTAKPRRAVLARRLLVRTLAAHVAVGERSARLAEAEFALPHGAVRTILNGVPRPPAGRVPEPRPAGAEVLAVAVGRLTSQKGLELLVDVLPGLPAVTAVLVGDGPERAALEARAAALGVGARLHVTGWTADPSGWLAAADLLVLPSVSEGFPLSVVEAMHAGLPVVATDVGSVAEAVHDGRTGFVVAPGDRVALAERIARLADDPELRARLGAAGRERAGRDLTAEAMVARYAALYAELLA